MVHKEIAPMDHKYEMLVKVLDRLASEAPPSYKKYHSNVNDLESLTLSRSLAFIHLLLKVKFGLTAFLERHEYITDGSQDGGIDAYFIDPENKKIFFIQSKFRTTSNGFTHKSMTASDLVRMEISRITKGESTDSNGNQFNGKIVSFQEKMREIRDIAKYEFIVVFLGNVTQLNDDQIRKLIDNCNYEIYNSDLAFNNLVFPISTGTYFDPDEIVIRLELYQKDSPKLKQTIHTDFGDYSVTVIFAPVSEIGRVMSKYKNALLKYNPRNFLSLQKKSVNARIKSSILEQEKNNFAILNNGITILSDNVNITESTGRHNEGQLIITKPQILNGGQTAYTLCEIYEEFKLQPNDPLKGKEVILKIITPLVDPNTIDTDFVKLISNATNQQNEVSEADRRSNHDIQMFLQEKYFEEYGYLYERKTGEFFDGIKQGFIDKARIINRLEFIKAYKAYIGEPAAARRTSEKILFREDVFYETLHDKDRYHDMYFAHLIFSELVKTEKTFRHKNDSIAKYGHSLIYGKWAVIASIGVTKPRFNPSYDDIFLEAESLVADRLSIWKEFEKFVRESRSNTKYFSEDSLNYELYYKVNNLDSDIREFFLK
jgi:hypothetical protein